MTKLHQLAELGQSIWLDYMRRVFVTSGELGELVSTGLRGVTSNPSIFEKAIAGSNDYDEDIQRLAAEGKKVEEIYETLTLADIQQAAEVLLPIYEATNALDGYVSLEVRPDLAYDETQTVAEARRLFSDINRPNVMIKVPATAPGIAAIETLIGDGYNINVTLIFSLKQYGAVTEAYLSGLEKLAATGRDISGVASVASFFISRVDARVDRQLVESGAESLMGKTAIANARLAYKRFLEIISSPRWISLAEKGARAQRILWASTSTKNPHYPDTLYVDELIGPHTVNTLPPSTLHAYLDHGTPASTLRKGLAEAQSQIDRLNSLGIDLEAINRRLLEEGVEAFSRSHQTLLESIGEKHSQLLAGWRHLEVSLGDYQPAVDSALKDLEQSRILARIWSQDHTVWKPDPTEIRNRLGWLNVAEMMLDNLHLLQDLRDDLLAEGYRQAVLLGMGGSSLAPEVFSETYQPTNGSDQPGLKLRVLDTTEPDTIRAAVADHELENTLFIVSTKSGGTVETLSLFKYFYNQVADRVGRERGGSHFIAITDPNSKLARLSEQYRFRALFLNDPNIGGRYSALSYFGLVPAHLAGVDVTRILDRALTSACGCDSCVTSGDNPGALLGVILGELARAGRDKLSILLSPQIIHFGGWVEQLIAESTGKEGRGILPVVEVDPGPPAAYSGDRLFVHMRLRDDTTHDQAIRQLEASGHPVVRIHLDDRYDLGGQFFLWEFATVIAGQRLGINPFDQPNVELAKEQARGLVAEFKETGFLPEELPVLRDGDISVYGNLEATSLEAALHAFLDRDRIGAPMSESGRPYIALQAFVQPAPGTTRALEALQSAIRDRTHLATTFGYGPRFLHSTGQLHKGDSGGGLFIQFTSDSKLDAPIPDEAGSAGGSISFGVLLRAQALGDQKALMETGRKVLRFHLGDDVLGGLARLSASFYELSPK